MSKLSNSNSFIRRRPGWLLLLAATALLGGGWWWFKGRLTASSGAATFTAKRGPLDITVLEGGSLQALESQEIKCEVRVGYQGTKILKIVDEGYLVTDDDVKTNKVLVELDSSEIEKQIVQQEIQYQSALASLTDAQQNYEIQVNQNQSDVAASEQKVRFARMDFDKFLGDTVTTDIVNKLGIDKLIAEASTNNVVAGSLDAPNVDRARPPGATNSPGLKTPNTNAPPRTPVRVTVKDAGDDPPIVIAPEARPRPGPPPVRPTPPDSAPMAKQPTFELPSTSAIDFEQYANLDVLGDGEAKQKLRKFDDDLQVAQKELGQATTTLEGTKRLFEKGFVTRNDLQRDEIAFDNSRLKVQTATTARDLYLKYDFPKSAEESLSKFLDSVRELDKTRRQAVSKLAQAEARLKSAMGQFEVQSRQRKDLQEQRDKCIILAKKSGLVVYGSGRDDMMYYGGEERIREGATVRERQAIITIPDMTRMSVNVKIHETYIKKVQKGQKARITVDAFPDKVLSGEVTKVSVLPDSQNRWMNPDLKVYGVTIAVDGTHEWVKPGMSSKVEIMVNRLEDVVQIPVQAVTLNEGKQVCYVVGGLKPERREVQIGEFTDEFIEIKSGLQAGERVLLRTPDGVESDTGKPRGGDKEKEMQTPAKPEKTADAPRPVKT